MSFAQRNIKTKMQAILIKYLLLVIILIVELLKFPKAINEFISISVKHHSCILCTRNSSPDVEISIIYFEVLFLICLYIAYPIKQFIV